MGYQIITELGIYYINPETGYIIKPIKDNNILYVSNLWYDNEQRCYYLFIQKLWNKIKGTLDIIDVHNEIDYMKKKEFYRYVPGFPGYRVSNYANIKNDKKNKYLTSWLNGSYYQITLCYDNEIYTKQFHQIMILTFKGYPPSNKHTIDHIDRVRTKG